MSSFEPAVAFTLSQEGGFNENPDTGELVNHGITAMFLHSIRRPFARADVEALSVHDAIDLYRTYFWDSADLDLIDDQALATKIFDLRVNMGMVPAIWCLQQAVNALLSLPQSPPIDPAGPQPPKLTVDGLCGPLTINAVNAEDPAAVLLSLRIQADIRYRRLAQNPKRAKSLTGWLDRLAKG